MSSNVTFQTFIKAKAIKKDDKTTQSTNTRIPSKEKKILPGKYSISDDDYNEFLTLYYRDIYSKGIKEYFTERQLKEDGPIVIDLDFHYENNVKNRIHTEDHISEFVCTILDNIKNIYQLDESVEIPIYVMQRNDVTLLDTETKDGIHILIGLKSNKTVEGILRNKMLPHLSSIFEKLPLTNSWEDVYDNNVTSGGSPWQLYGCQKPNSPGPYLLTNIYNAYYDETDDEFGMDEIDVARFNLEENIMKLSVRYTNNLELFMKSSFMPEYEEFYAIINNVRSPKNNQTMSTMELDPLLQRVSGDEQNIISQLSNHEELELMVNRFLETTAKDDHSLEEIYHYTMALPASYYESGSYSKWIRVCWALASSNRRLLLVWIAFSAKSSTFSFSTIGELLERWNDALVNIDGYNLTWRSIAYWVKEENPERYNEIIQSSIRNIIDTLFFGIGVKYPLKTRVLDSKSPISDEAIALILYHSYKNDYVCGSIKSNKWYRIHKGRWVEDEEGTSLRRRIRELPRHLFGYINDSIAGKTNLATTEEEEKRLSENKCDKSSWIRDLQSRNLQICTKLGDAQKKRNVMTEAKDLFYDEDFIEKLDTNKHLIAFTNGVIDFNEKIFRECRPDDYISLSTNINYIKLKPQHEPIIAEIKEFFEQVYPNESLREYIFQYFATMMTGWNKPQTGNFFLGNGANGKSAMLSLMGHVLGEYKIDMNPNLITDKRTRIGTASPEVCELRGKRCLQLTEMKKSDLLNEDVFKQYTAGNDLLTGRPLYGHKNIQFYPQFKLSVLTNYLPTINATDNGTWRRVRVVPHDALFTDEPDPNNPLHFKKVDETVLNDKFVRWKEVFASMLVNKVFETNGHVKNCEEVLTASKSYKETQDSIAEFLRDKVVENPASKLSKQDISAEFSFWYQQTYGRGGPTPADLYAYMDKKYGVNTRGIWRGIELIRGGNYYDDDDDSDIIDESESEDECNEEFEE